MDRPGSYVVRPTRTATWNLVRDGEAVGSAFATGRPDGRWHVSVDSWHEDDYPPLLAAVTDELRRDLRTTVRAEDVVELERWHRLGFAPARRVLELEIPVDPAMVGSTAPAGIALVPADAVAEDPLRELHDRLRSDVPGADPWRSDPQEFRDRTFDAHFDPLTYLVAVDDWRQEFAGLVRIGIGATHARLGMIGVVARYRRQGLGRALLGAALVPLPERGIAVVTAEIDATDLAARRLFDGVGAVATGELVELLRPWGLSADDGGTPRSGSRTGETG